MTTYTEPYRASEIILSEADGTLSRGNVTIVSGAGVLTAGTVLGKITKAGTATSAAFAGNTGNGTMGTVTVSAGAKAGIYKLVIIEPGTNVGTFEVTGPDGILVSNGVVASAFSAGGLAFTLADGATDFVSGDGFNITVTAGSGKYKWYDDGNTDGSEVACAILLEPIDASSADVSAAVLVRMAEVKKDILQWNTAVDSTAKTLAYAQLEASPTFIVAR